MNDMTIATLARAGDVGVETIRFYQRRGLLRTPERPRSGTASGQIRRYDDVDLKRLKFIRSAQKSGFTLEEIAELLIFDATDDREAARRLAAKRIKALDEKIAELTAARKALHHLAHACAASDEGPCPIFSAFDRF
jgi:MerR family transcriptional regulator, mercuric resistance operon regulatory protein